VFHSCKRPISIEMLGPLKPWHWWTYPIATFSWPWYVLRQKMPHYWPNLKATLLSPGLIARFTIPALVLFFLVRRMKRSCFFPSDSSDFANVVIPATPAITNIYHFSSPFFITEKFQGILKDPVPTVSVVVGMVTFWLSLRVGMGFVPVNLDPYSSWFIFGEFFIFSCIFLTILYCYGLYHVNLRSDTQSKLSAPQKAFLYSQLSFLSYWWIGAMIGWLLFSIYVLPREMYADRTFVRIGVAIILFLIWNGIFVVGFYKISTYFWYHLRACSITNTKKMELLQPDVYITPLDAYS